MRSHRVPRPIEVCVRSTTLTKEDDSWSLVVGLFEQPTVDWKCQKRECFIIVLAIKLSHIFYWVLLWSRETDSNILSFFLPPSLPLEVDASSDVTWDATFVLNLHVRFIVGQFLDLQNLEIQFCWGNGLRCGVCSPYVILTHFINQSFDICSLLLKKQIWNEEPLFFESFDYMFNAWSWWRG